MCFWKKKKKKEHECKSLCWMSFKQALGVMVYCGLVGLIFWKGTTIFGKVPNYWGPVAFLMLFATSALVCAFLTLAKPTLLIWKEKKPVKGVKLIAYTGAWLVGMVTVMLLVAWLKRCCW